MKLRAGAIVTVVVLGSTVSQAALFDVTSANATLGTAEGTSNGVGFTFTGSLWSARTFTDENYQGFNTGNHIPGMPDSDSLHTGTAPTFTFDQSISSALIYLSDNVDGAYTHFWDFGVTATAVSGDVEVLGTAFRITSATGGVIQLTNINSNVLASSDVGDGNDLAVVVTPVPEPASLLALAAVPLLARRRKKLKSN